ncbi:MAG: gspG [Candidatus Doudnabacteria bacterium]|nr:gspG [Candidatus Doudnabacteria bacterium]
MIVQKSKQFVKGFTLIELIVVIAIISLLASIVLINLNVGRQKSRAAKRYSDLKQVQSALELYYTDFGSYPQSASSGGLWNSQCPAWGSVAANSVIPGLVPKYLAAMPADPSQNIPTNNNCYLYRSDGTGYKFMDFNVYDIPAADLNKYPQFQDPVYYNYAACGIYSAATNAISVYSRSWRCSG